MAAYHTPPGAPEWPLRPGQQLPPLPLAMRPLVAAKAIGISPRTLWSLTKRGAIPHAKFGRVTIYPTAAILAWLEEITAHPPVQRPPAAGGDS